MFSYSSRVKYSELDRTGRLSTEALINYFQDTTNFHSDSVGLDWKSMMEQNRAWLMCYWKVLIGRKPGFGEAVTVETRPYAYDGLFGRRCFELKDAGGQSLARADSLWFLYDISTGHPVMREPQFLEPYGLDEPLDMELIKRRRIALPKEMAEQEPFRVRKDVLDTNYHVNNCRYIAMAEEYFPADGDISELHVEYRQQARYGDLICPKTADGEDGFRYIALCAEDGDVFAALKVK